MACDDETLSKFRIERSLKVFCKVILELQLPKHLWWILDDNVKSRQRQGDVLTLFEQIGIESKKFVEVYGARWKSKAGVLPCPLAVTTYDNCNFVTVCLNKSEVGSTCYVEESGIVKKNDDKMQYVKDVISERVQLEVDAYLRKMTDESNTADDMDTTDVGEADTSFDTTTSGDTDASMEEVDGSHV